MNVAEALETAVADLPPLLTGSRQPPRPAAMVEDMPLADRLRKVNADQAAADEAKKAAEEAIPPTEEASPATLVISDVEATAIEGATTLLVELRILDTLHTTLIDLHSSKRASIRKTIRAEEAKLAILGSA